MRSAALGTLVVVVVAACSATGDDPPREELEGTDDDAGAGTGGTVLPGVGGAGGGTTASTTVGVTVGVGGAGGAGSCSGLDEPNDSEATALSIGAINDCDDDGAMLAGALDGPTDEDWYFYSGSDDFGCVVDPTRAVTATGTLRLCKFAECDGVSVSCQNGSQPANSPKGNPGCCHTQGFGMDVDCSGVSDDATIHLRFDQAGSACVEYSLDYHY
ncbi:MAG: hypothetical protein RIF41_30390 [Polyangiaceae bacterium]